MYQGRHPESFYDSNPFRMLLSFQAMKCIYSVLLPWVFFHDQCLHLLFLHYNATWSLTIWTKDWDLNWLNIGSNGPNSNSCIIGGLSIKPTNKIKIIREWEPWTCRVKRAGAHREEGSKWRGGKFTSFKKCFASFHVLILPSP